MLRLEPNDTLAAQTKIQILIAVDRYPEALALLNADSDKLTRAYCLYKTGREGEAQQAIGELDDEEGEDRATKLLEAQVVSCGDVDSLTIPDLLFILRATVSRITRPAATCSRISQPPSTT